MDLKAFKLDIDELINEFSEFDSTAFGEFKRVWLSRKFSYIFEAIPSTNQGFFMQSLYAHSIGYMVSPGSLSSRLGGLYCLYCLYETQSFNPPFKIYLSLGELRQLKKLAIESKTLGVKVVSAILKTMLEKNMFLFGFVGVDEGSATERVNELTDIQNARIQTAYKKLFANSRLEHFIHMDMGAELDVDVLKKMSSDYAAAKDLAIKEAGAVIDVENIKHIAENKRLIGDTMEKTAADWKSEKDSFYEHTGFSHLPVVVPPNQEQNNYVQPQTSNEDIEHSGPCDILERLEGNEESEEHENDDIFGKELEDLLFQP